MRIAQRSTDDNWSCLNSDKNVIMIELHYTEKFGLRKWIEHVFRRQRWTFLSLFMLTGGRCGGVGWEIRMLCENCKSQSEIICRPAICASRNSWFLKWATFFYDLIFLTVTWYLFYFQKLYSSMNICCCFVNCHVLPGGAVAGGTGEMNGHDTDVAN